MDSASTNTAMKKNVFQTQYGKVTHVIFGLDGILLDTESLNGQVLKQICNQYEKEFTDELHQRTAGSMVEDIAKMLIEELSLPLTADAFIKHFNDKFKEVCTDIKLMPGSERLVRHLYKCKVPISVATSSTQELMLAKTEAYKDFFSLFHHLVNGDSDPEAKKGKPATDVFLLCASRFDEKPKPEQCLVFEGTYNGVKGALAAGMYVVMVPSVGVPYDIWKEATVVLDSLQQFLPESFGLAAFETLEHLIPTMTFERRLEKASEDDPFKAWENIKSDVRKSLLAQTGINDGEEEIVSVIQASERVGTIKPSTTKDTLDKEAKFRDENFK